MFLCRRTFLRQCGSAFFEKMLTIILKRCSNCYLTKTDIFSRKQFYDSTRKIRCSYEKKLVSALLGLLVARVTLNAQLLPTGLEIPKTEDQIKLAWRVLPRRPSPSETERLRDNIGSLRRQHGLADARQTWTYPFDRLLLPKVLSPGAVEPSNRESSFPHSDATYSKFVLQLIVAIGPRYGCDFPLWR
jgi:hypothetical protein